MFVAVFNIKCVEYKAGFNNKNLNLFLDFPLERVESSASQLCVYSLKVSFTGEKNVNDN